MLTVKDAKIAIKKSTNVYLYVKLTEEDAYNIPVSKTVALNVFKNFGFLELVNVVVRGSNVYIG